MEANLILKEVGVMTTLDAKKFGLAVGSTFGLFYLGCVIVVMSVGKGGVVFIFNTLFHGLDVTPLIRTEMPAINMVIGLIEIFIFGWLLGATIASIYNFSVQGGFSKK